MFDLIQRVCLEVTWLSQSEGGAQQLGAATIVRGLEESTGIEKQNESRRPAWHTGEDECRARRLGATQRRLRTDSTI